MARSRLLADCPREKNTPYNERKVNHMKKIVGRCIAFIGACLWENGGWTGDERYKDLKVTGKLGYNMFCTGLKMMGITLDDIENMTNL